MARRRKRRCTHTSPVIESTDLIQNILVRLPVESLLRFKSVCKSWCSLIESSSFIDLHTAFNSSKFGSFILLASVVDKRSPKPYTTLRDSLIMLSSDQVGGGLELQMDLGVPSCYEHCYFFKKIVGTCNGLVCLHDTDVNMVSLWNPATKEHRILPKPIKFGVEDWPYHLAAFGFDLQTKDYKVVLLTSRSPEYYRAAVTPICPVQVYSLSTDSWKVVEGITSLPGDPFLHPREGLYMNGSCFFLASFFRTKHYLPRIPENDRFIIKFDLTKEIITPIQLPDHHRDDTLYLTCLADKMALFTVKYQPRLITYPPTTEFCDDYNIWALLNEHGSSNSNVNKDSWTKLHSFRMAVQRTDERNIPRGISNDGNFALLEIKDSTGLGERMKLYHLVSKEVKKNFLSCGSVTSKANAYKPSLVSIIGGNGAAY